ncbi:NAD(P)-dependent oxidoreductase [Phycisphaera mikurensis]|uniref:Putative oxidoreductase n=1 Tax=Phycisphaera mikurensis (strain NBRC 102666 / KCTC 22515 / FYK2301M01) TaxID=1142394 RepID=I0IAP4_PHYMF|nr:NAD(P)-dependent oxidoreductase [Phycisphaera mikurensis]MBB6441673.1 D-3-phosphoglycerate dehydrogenase [Phycisphaera mikurensis]BAM02332.1 putative oxidoreductase [Phycisphaera mikurensis NBRC 102666]
MIDVLVTNLVMQRDAPAFAAELDAAGVRLVPHPVKQALGEAELLALFGSRGFDGWIAGDDEVTDAVLAAATPRLRLIAKWGVGLDSFDLDAARRRGVQVRNTPGAFGVAVAEVAVGYLLMLTRHLLAVDAAVRAGGWPKPEGRGLAGSVVGIVGLGAIGRATAARLAGFGCRLLGADPAAEPPAGVEPAPLPELLAQADHVVLCCPLVPATRRLLDAAALAAMKPGATLVNVARGPVVDEPSLHAALAAGRLSGAALDVFAEEPLPRESPLRDLPGVILGSHNANNLAAANAAVNRACIDAVLGLR